MTVTADPSVTCPRSKSSPRVLGMSVALPVGHTSVKLKMRKGKASDVTVTTGHQPASIVGDIRQTLVWHRFVDAAKMVVQVEFASGSVPVDSPRRGFGRLILATDIPGCRACPVGGT